MRVMSFRAAFIAAGASAYLLSAWNATDERALIYCPVSIDSESCSAIVQALRPAFPGAVDMGYDGSSGTLDLRNVDLGVYALVVIPSLADDAETKPYALLRDSVVTHRLHDHLIGRVAIWSGTPDHGANNRTRKDALLRTLASWAAGSFPLRRGPGLLVLQDNSDDEGQRYRWLEGVAGLDVVADSTEDSFDTVHFLTGDATPISGAGTSLGYENIASSGVRWGSPTPGQSSVAAGVMPSGADGPPVLLVSRGGSSGTAVVSSDRAEYAPFDTAAIIGTGWKAGEHVAVTLHEDPQVHDDVVLDASADAAGRVAMTFELDDHATPVRFIVTAIGDQGSRAQSTLRDTTGAPIGVFTIRIGSVTAGPQTPSPVTAGTSATYAVTVLRGTGSGSTGSFTATMTVRSGLPSGATATFSPKYVPFSKTQNSAATTLTIATKTTTPGGTFTVHLRATTGATDTAGVDIALAVTAVNQPPVLTSIRNKSVTEGNLLTFTAAATDKDVPPQVLTYSLINAPAGAAIDSASGVFRWTPTEAQGPGSYSVKVRVTDNGSPPLYAERTPTITVNETNATPVIAPIASQSVDEATLYSFQPTGSDADLPANTLTWSLVTAPTGMTIDVSTGQISWLPSESQGGTAVTVKVQLTDNGSPVKSATQSYQLTVGDVNGAPVPGLIGAPVVDEGTALAFTATATDPDLPANTLTWSLVGAPPGATIDAATGAFSWTPTEAQGAGQYAFTVRVTDNGSPALFADASVNVTVNEVNAAPVVSAIPDQQIDEASTLSLTASGSDSDLPVNTLTWSLAGAPAGMAIDPTTGTITWTPSEADGPSVHTVVVRLTDSGASALYGEVSFQVTVREVNDSPVLAAVSSQTVDEGTTLTLAMAATDADLPANRLTWSLVGAPAGATIDSTTGALTWTPNGQQGGSTYSFTVHVVDDGTLALSADQTVQVVVRDLNASPVVAAIPDQVVDELTALSLTASGSDADLPAQQLTWSLIGAPVGMSIDPATGAIAWTPAEADGPGTVTVTVRLTDNGPSPLFSETTMKVTVGEVNVAPVMAALASQNVDKGALLSFSASATDADLPANQLTWSLVGAPPGASIDTQSGAVSWTPTAQQVGTHTFTVHVVDDGTPAASADQSVTVVVRDFNQAPAITAIADQQIDELTALTVNAAGSDPDQPAQQLTWSLVGAPSGMTIDAGTGVISWTPSEADGPTVVTVTVRLTDDGSPALFGEMTMKVTVSDVNAAPVLAAITALSVSAGDTARFTATASDADLPANRLTYALVGAPAGAAINDSTGAFAWTPTAQQAGANYTFAVRVTDDGTPALYDEKQVTITVPAPPSVATVTVTPDVGTLVPSATLALTAEAKDSAGVVIAGRPTTWVSSDPAVLTVDQTGQVAAVTPGQATVTVRIDGVAAVATLTVRDGGIADPAGNSITAANGVVRVDVPPGAVTQSTFLFVDPVTPPVTDPLYLSPAAYSVQPANGAWLQPLTVTVSFGSIVLPGWVLPTELRLRQISGSVASDLPGTSVDPSGKTVTASLSAAGTVGIFSSLPRLRERSTSHGILIGAAVRPASLRQDTTYRALVISQYSSVTADNAMKFQPIHPQPNTYNFVQSDSLVAAAQENGMAVHGHTLIWGNQNPTWITNGTWTRSSLLAVMKSHILTVVGRYSGRIGTWDVVNEVIDDDNASLAPSIWMQVIGADYIDSAFVWARQADPAAKLYINDFGIEGQTTRAGTLRNLIAGLQARGIPIDGVGLEYHLTLTPPPEADLAMTMHQFAQMGLDVRVSELDVRVPDSGGSAELQQQATIYGGVLDACLAEPRCKSVTTWGFTDADSWIPGRFPGFGRALPFDAALQPKAAFFALGARLLSP